MDNRKFVSKNLQIVIMVFLSVIRVLLSVRIGVWFPAAQLWDDNLMMEYTALKMHFLHPVYYSLVKTMSFPLLLNAFSYTMLPYTVLLGLIWVMAAFFVYFLLKKLFDGKLWICFIGFLYVLFMPQAFDVWSGTRLYRTAVIAPFVIVSICLMIHMILDARKTFIKRVLTLVALGFCFAFTFYLKEDGIWLLACLIFATLIAAVYGITNPEYKGKIKKIVLKGLSLFIPLGVFLFVVVAYKAVNYKFFGVFEVNTRTDSEYGEFIEKVYSVESDERSLYVWAPTDAIKKVFDASQTLSSHPELLEAIMTTPWYDNDIVNNPIQGDHFAWIFRDCLVSNGMYQSEAEVRSFMRTVNRELDESFKNGKLKKQSDVINIIGATGGYTWEEVRSLSDDVASAFMGAVFLKGYLPGLGEVSENEILDNYPIIDTAIKYTHLKYLEDYSKQSEISASLEGVLIGIFYVYKVINGILLLLTVGLVLFELIKFFVSIKSLESFVQKRYNILLGAMASLIFLGIGLLYSFFIGWFSAFLFKDGINMTVLNFYNVALPSICMFAYIFAVWAVTKEIKLIKRGE